MSSSSLIRWGGLAAIVAGALWAAASVFDLTYFSPKPFSALAQTGSFLLQQVLYLLGGLVLLVGLVGLYARQAQAAGGLGLLGFLAVFAATVLGAGFFWSTAFVDPALAHAAPKFLGAGPPRGFFLTYIGLGIGWLVFGIATLRAGVYPRGAAILVIVGAVVFAFPLPFTPILLSVAVAWLGLHLFTGREAAEARTSPRVS